MISTWIYEVTLNLQICVSCLYVYPSMTLKSSAIYDANCRLLKLKLKLNCLRDLHVIVSAAPATANCVGESVKSAAQTIITNFLFFLEKLARTCLFHLGHYCTANSPALNLRYHRQDFETFFLT